MINGLEDLRSSMVIISGGAMFFLVVLLFAYFFHYLILSAVLYYYYLIVSLIPYLVIAVFTFRGFKGMTDYNKKYFIGIIGSIFLFISYLLNLVYLVSETIKRQPIVFKVIEVRAIKGFVIFYSLSLPVPIVLSVLLGLLGIGITMVALFLLGNSFASLKLKIGSIASLIGFILLVVPVLGAIVIVLSSLLLYLGLGDVEFLE
ncbi:MAG: hypothetical protein OWQ54_04520 [Sulfolobaceae archaeon]|nr:hypothetical protein [Sulfolobaceae archaeon]